MLICNLSDVVLAPENRKLLQYDTLTLRVVYVDWTVMNDLLNSVDGGDLAPPCSPPS